GPRSWLRKLVAREGRSRSQSNGAREAGSPTHSTEHWGETHALDDRHVTLQPAGAPDAWHLFDLWTHATPPAIARIEGYSAADWDSVGHEAIVPRSSLSPILHFTEVDAWLMPHDQRAGGLAQHGACRESPHYLRFLIRDGTDGVAFLRAVLDAIGPDAASAGLLAPVRTYESTGVPGGEVLLDREIGDADIANVVNHIGVFGDDNRAGIERTLHRISAIRNRAGKVVGLTCRIGRAVFGTIEIIRDIVESGRSILLL